MSDMSHDEFRRIEERARDPRRRTYMSAVEADAEPVDFARLKADFERHGAPGAQGLLRMADMLETMLGKLGGGIAMGPAGPMRFGGEAPSGELAPRPEPEVIDAMEMVIGRPLPGALRQLYAIADGGFGPGNGLLPLGEMVRRYSENTTEPFGPMGQEWPGNLLPLFEEDPVLVCLDCDSGAIIAWDPEEIEDLESEDDWQRSFKREHDSLAQCMEAWLDSPVFGE